jgi:Reverse transcriptase (RNA-dependent DNA polymerase)
MDARPNRGCHTGLREIYHHWRGVTWLIEGDIAHCFEKLSHELLLEVLKEHIHDGRFLKLMQDLLDAGYMEDWTCTQTLSGVPQGGIVSPILSNILLDKLDKFVENVLIPHHTRGSKRKINPEYDKLRHDSRNQRRKGNTEKAEELRKHAQTLPSVVTNDPDYRRLKYVRYADDFVLGFVGPRSEAEEIKQQRSQVPARGTQTGTRHEEKTLLTHAVSEAARFLGYEITLMQDDTKRTKRRDTGRMCRSINRVIGLRVPQDVLKAKIDRYQKNGEATQRTELIKASDYTIVLTYQLEFRGLANYYQLAYNMRT